METFGKKDQDRGVWHTVNNQDLSLSEVLIHCLKYLTWLEDLNLAKKKRRLSNVDQSYMKVVLF